MKSFFLLLSYLCLIGFGCATNSKLAKNEEGVPKKETHSEIKTAILGDNNQTSILTTIYKVDLTDNVLRMEIGYAGGCAKHEFELIGSELISKSLPPIRSINLIHKTLEEESCKRAMYDTLYFDLRNLAYQKSNGSVIKLNLAGWKEQITYSFE